MVELSSHNRDLKPTKSQTFASWLFTENVCEPGSQWTAIENISKLFTFKKKKKKGTLSSVLCSVSETNASYDQGAVPIVKKLQKAHVLAMRQ